MKGLVVTPAYYPDKSKGGSISGCRSFAKAISMNHQIEISTLDTTKQGERIKKVDNIKVSYFSITNGLEWLSKSGWGFSLNFSFWFIKNYKNYDYIYIRSLWNYISLFTSIVCILSGKRYGISSSGKFSKYALKSSYNKKLLVLPLVLFIIKKSKFIHYPSKSEYRTAPKYLSKLSYPIILSTAIEIKNQSNNNERLSKINKKLIYTVSRFHEIKRIEIFAKISDTIEANVDFIHIGNYEENLPYFQYIEDIYKNKKFEINYDLASLFNSKSRGNKVFFPGYLDIDEVDELAKHYQESIFIQMSYSEGQSNSILEAMSRGSVCIVSEGCNMQIAKDLNSIIVSNKYKLKKDIKNLITEEKLFKKIKNNQHKYLKDFHSLKQISNQFDKDLRSLL